MDDKLKESLPIIYESVESDLILRINTELWNDRNKPELNKKKYEDIILKAYNEYKKIPTLDNENYKALKLLVVSANKNVVKANKIWRIKDKDNLKSEIRNYMRSSLKQGYYIKTENGRKYEFKSYMEMKVRTEIAKEDLENANELRESTKNPLVVCNIFEDCADDHKELQGKVYYDARYKSWGLSENYVMRLENYINKNKLLSIQEVTGDLHKKIKGVKIGWLTTRPNCRHRFVPITLKQCEAGVKEFIKENKLSTGTYKDSKYKASQELRKAERNLRYFKAQRYQAQMVGNDDLIKLYNRKINMWNKRANSICNQAGEWLQRDYRRETQTQIIKDLGLKYNEL